MFRSGPGVLICCAVLSSCGGGEQKTTGAAAQPVPRETSAGDILALTAKVAALEAKVSNLEMRKGSPADMTDKVAALDGKVLKLEFDQSIARLSGPQERVLLDPQADKAYRTVKAPGGQIFVVLEKVEPYLDGFVVFIRLGNPSAAAYSGLHAKVQWGRAYDPSKDDTYNELAEKEIELSDVLPSGAWTVVKFNIAPAQVDQVRRILFSPVFNSVRLRGPVLQ